MRPALLLAVLLATVTACSSSEDTGRQPHQSPPPAATDDVDDEQPTAHLLPFPSSSAAADEAGVHLELDSSDDLDALGAAADRANQDRLSQLSPEYYAELERQDAERMRQLVAEYGDASDEVFEPADDSSGDLPADLGALLIRTDFTHPQHWQALLLQTSTPTQDGATPALFTVDHPRWQDASPADVIAAAPPGELLILADKQALTSPELTLLVITTVDGQPQQLRVAASALASVENNLSLANMDWRDFTDAADPDGVFRGF